MNLKFTTAACSLTLLIPAQDLFANCVSIEDVGVDDDDRCVKESGVPSPSSPSASGALSSSQSSNVVPSGQADDGEQDADESTPKQELGSSSSDVRAIMF